jgi:hypothetical protein
MKQQRRISRVVEMKQPAVIVFCQYCCSVERISLGKGKRFAVNMTAAS